MANLHSAPKSRRRSLCHWFKRVQQRPILWWRIAISSSYLCHQSKRVQQRLMLLLKIAISPSSLRHLSTIRPFSSAIHAYKSIDARRLEQRSQTLHLQLILYHLSDYFISRMLCGFVFTFTNHDNAEYSQPLCIPLRSASVSAAYLCLCALLLPLRLSKPN